MTIKINEVLTGKKKDLIPVKDGEIGIYVCGVTVYDRCHIGHMRSFMSFDAIVRYLEYSGYKTTYVRNFTDIDDKVIMRASEMSSGNDEWKKSQRYETFTEADWELRKEDDKKILKSHQNSGKHLSLDVSEYFIDVFNEDFAPFELRKPDFEPKVSDHISEIIDMIRKIIDNGFAYVENGSVYFDVPTYHSATKSYGKLSGRNYEQLMDGARVTPDDEKHNGVDFALWKAAKPGEPAWDSPWGKGRPGWHIECSVMSTKYLGNGFDIHGGGKDLIFPHHENEIAQAEAANGTTFVQNWMHNGFVTVNGVKMSKSLGNFLSVKDALELALPEVWRYLVLSVHYSSPIDFSFTQKDSEGNIVRGSVDIATERVKYFYATLKRIDDKLADIEIPEDAQILDPDKNASFSDEFKKVMNDDFNTALAIAVMGEVAKSMNDLVSLKSKQIKKLGKENWAATLKKLKNDFSEMANALNLLNKNPEEFLNNLKDFLVKKHNLNKAEIETLIEQRNSAKAERDFAKADEIRSKLASIGIEIMDLPGNKTEWDVKL